MRRGIQRAHKEEKPASLGRLGPPRQSVAPLLSSLDVLALCRRSADEGRRRNGLEVFPRFCRDYYLCPRGDNLGLALGAAFKLCFDLIDAGQNLHFVSDVIAWHSCLR